MFLSQGVSGSPPFSLFLCLKKEKPFLDGDSKTYVRLLLGCEKWSNIYWIILDIIHPGQDKEKFSV